VGGDETAFVSGISLETVTTLTVTPSTGVPGIGLVATAGGFTPFETVNLIAFAGSPTPTTIGTATADASGVANVAGHLPQTPFGACGLQAVGQSSGAVASGIMSVRARISVSPNTLAPGDAITVTGYGFAAGEVVISELANPATLVGKPTAGQNGSFSFYFLLPPSPAGTDEVLAQGQKTGALAGAEITVQ
jgi:hypothetical protein